MSLLTFLEAVPPFSVWEKFSEEAQVMIAGALLLVLNRVAQWVMTKKWKRGLSVDLGVLQATVDGLVTSQKVMGEKIEEIRHEFEINGGGTVKAALLNLIDVQAAHATILFNSTDEAAFQCDKKGNWSFANESLMELMGLGYPELMKRKWLEAVPNVKERLELFASWKSCAEDDIPFSKSVHIRNAKTGTLYFCEIRASPFRGKYNKKNQEAPILFYYGKIKVIRTLSDGEGEVL